MFLYLSKSLDWFTSPLSWALLLALLGLLARARPRLRRALLGAALLVVVAFSTRAVARRLDALVEGGVHATFRPEVTYDAVIVLGGMVDEPASRRSGQIEFDRSVDRLLRAFELLRAGRARAVLLSGGAVFPLPGDVPEADRLAAKLVQWGIPPSQVVVEAASRNTRENAVESARVAAARGWKRLLVITSAFHVPRAMGCFRAVGLEPDVLPVDWQASDGRPGDWVPRAQALGRSADAIHELVGRVVYRLMGYTR